MATGAPWYGVRHGRAGVAAFFEAFGSTVAVDEFTPLAFAAADDQVHAVVRCRGTARSTGKSFDQQLHHFFRLDDGKIVYYRGSEDTAQVEATLRP